MTIDSVLSEVNKMTVKHFLENKEKIKQALLEIIKKAKPKKQLVSKVDGFNHGYNQGVEEYEKAIEDLFK